MKLPETQVSEYYKRSAVYLIKSRFLYFIVSFIEYIDILLLLINETSQLFYYEKEFNDKDNKLSKVILTISPFQYYFEFLQKDKDKTGITKAHIISFVYIALYIYYFSFFNLIKNFNLDETTGIIQVYQKINVNFFDYGLFRLLSIYGICAITNIIVKVSSIENYDFSDGVILFFAFVLLMVVLFTNFIYFTEITLWSNFKAIDSFFTNYPFDNFFSMKLDLLFLVIKLNLCFNKNYLLFNNKIIDNINIFLSICLLFCFIGFIIYLAYVFFFSDEALYFFINFYNKVRLFYFLFAFEMIILRLLLHEDTDSQAFFSYCFLLAIFDCFLVTLIFESYVTKKATKSQNFLAVCWFIQVNTVNISRFTNEWIGSHRIVCEDDNCEICAEVGGKGDKESNLHNILEEHTDEYQGLFERETTTISADSNKKKNKFNNNFIMKLFPPFKFNHILIKQSLKKKKYLSEDDKIRLDFLQLSVLLLSTQNVEFQLFSKICKLIVKYKENLNVSVSLVLLFDVVRKNKLDLIKGYEILKKNEDFRDALKSYIQVYEYFLYYSDKSPESYIEISGKFNQFKEMVHNIQILFKKNIECNYQLLLMRYAFETLIHIKFKSVQPFDLSFYSDFLDFHFSNDKLFVISYIIDQDLFKIVKASKDVLKYQGHNLEVIFPDNLSQNTMSKLRKQLDNINNEDEKPIFECCANDFSHNENLGFVTALKMKYFIYPTTNINELLIQANYINEYINVIIFEKNEENILVLDTFSPAIYKFFGLTPNMAKLLRKSANISISFADLFNEKVEINIDRINYLFKYETYANFYNYLLSVDGLNDIPNYQQLKDKKKEMNNLASERKEIIFAVSKREEINEKDASYVIYTMKEIKKKKMGGKTFVREPGNNGGSINGSLTNGGEDEENISDFDELDAKNQFNGKGMTIGAASISSASLSRSSVSVRTNGRKGKRDEKEDEKIKKSQELKKFCVISVIMWIFLMGMAMIFLVLLINENKKFKNIFNLSKAFKTFKRGAESAPLSLFSNFKYFNGEKGINNYEIYSDNLANNYPDLQNHKKINLLIKEEIRQKYDTIIQSFNDYQKNIHNLNSEIVQEISEITSHSYKLTIVNKVVKLTEDDMDLVSLCREFNNYITVLLEDDEYMDETFSLLSINNANENFSEFEVNLHYQGAVTQTTKNMLLLLLAYPSIHLGLKKSDEYIEEQFQSSLKSIKHLLEIFFILLIIFHVGYAIVLFIFLYVYKNMLKIYITSSNTLFSDKRFMQMQDRRLDQIKLLVNLYSENPNKISERIEIIDEIYKRKLNQERGIKKDLSARHVLGLENEDGKSKSSTISDTFSMYSSKSNDKKFTNNFSGLLSKKTSGTISNAAKEEALKAIEEKDKKKTEEEINAENAFSRTKNLIVRDKAYNKIINRYRMILIISFIIFFIYSIVFFIFALNGQQRLSYLVDYDDVNNLIDEYIFDNVNCLIYLIVTNSTSKFYGKIVYKKDDYDYLAEGIKSFYLSAQEKQTLEEEHPSLFSELHNYVNLNCSESIIQDTYFMSAIEALGDKYEDFFNALCQPFDIAKLNDDNFMYFEVLHLVENEYMHYKPRVTFEEIFDKHVKSPKLYELFTLVLTFLRIIRTYFNEHILSDQVSVNFDYFTSLIMAYLILAVVVEIALFIVLCCEMLLKINKSNSLLTDFLASLKY